MGQPDRDDDDDRVSLAPLSFRESLKGLLGVKPKRDEKDRDQQPSDDEK